VQRNHPAVRFHGPLQCQFQPHPPGHAVETLETCGRSGGMPSAHRCGLPASLTIGRRTWTSLPGGCSRALSRLSTCQAGRVRSMSGAAEAGSVPGTSPVSARERKAAAVSPINGRWVLLSSRAPLPPAPACDHHQAGAGVSSGDLLCFVRRVDAVQHAASCPG
jgi:hypothetical protein